MATYTLTHTRMDHQGLLYAEQCGVMRRGVWGHDLDTRIHTHAQARTHACTHARTHAHTHTSTGTERCDLSNLVSKVDDVPDAADSNFAVELFHSSATGSQNRIEPLRIE